MPLLQHFFMHPKHSTDVNLIHPSVCVDGPFAVVGFGLLVYSSRGHRGLEKTLLARLKEFSPDLLIISAGGMPRHKCSSIYVPAILDHVVLMCIFVRCFLLHHGRDSFLQGILSSNPDLNHSWVDARDLQKQNSTRRRRKRWTDVWCKTQPSNKAGLASD